MSYFSEPEVKRIELSGHNPAGEAYFADIKTDLKYGDVKKFISLNKEGQVSDTMALDRFLEGVIVAWNLDDGDGIVAPIDEAHINQLSKDDAVAIISEVGASIAGDQEAKTDFLDKSEASSPSAK